MDGRTASHVRTGVSDLAAFAGSGCPEQRSAETADSDVVHDAASARQTSVARSCPRRRPHAALQTAGTYDETTSRDAVVPLRAPLLHRVASRSNSRSSGVSPLRFAMRANIRGPISS